MERGGLDVQTVEPSVSGPGSRPRLRLGLGLGAPVRADRSIRVPAGVPAGVLATITMDVAMVAASSLGGSAFTSDRTGLDVIGRWAAGLLRGRWRHVDIGKEPARRSDSALGLLTHYGTGIVLTQAFLLLPHRADRRPSVGAAVVYGIATSALPLLVLFPSLGYGPFGLRSGEAVRINRIMLLGHTAFGVGIGVWGRARRDDMTEPRVAR